jgi:uncharacterized protein
VKLCLAAAIVLFGASAAFAADTALIDAVKAKQHDAAVSLLEKGADVRAREVDGTTALHYAAHYDDADLVKRLLEAGADAKAVNDYGATPLGEAAVTGDPAIIKALLAAGADAKATNQEGQTPLMVVARTGNLEAAKLLLRARVDVNAKEQWGGQSALMWAAAQQQPAMVKLLIQHKADVNARSVVRDWQRRITAEGRPKDMNRGGLTPLLFASREGCIECARELVKAGADINLADPDGTTPLVLALMNMRFDLASYLIQAGADINKWDFFGQTPLYVAVDLNTLPRGGRPDLPSTDNLTGYDLAAQLLAAGANPNPQLKLRPPYRNAVFDRGGDMVLSTGATPLLLAAKVGDAASVALLLKHKARLDIANADGVTPTMAAAGMGHTFNPTRGRFKTDEQAAQCLELLMAAGGDVRATNREQITAMHSAASLGWNDTIKLLIEAGAPLEALDARGMAPIDYAVGRHPRAFLEPEHTRKESTITLLRNYVVASTGRPPKEFDGTMNVQTRGTGASGF